MSGLSPALAAQLKEVIDRWGANQAQFSDWLAGTVGGGPNTDGRYPLTSAQGVEVSVAAPATIMDMVEGPAAQAQVAKLAAQSSASAAATSASSTDAAKVLAEAAKTAAVAARNLAQTAQSNAANHEANARYWAELAVGKGGEIVVMVETVTDLAQQVAADAVSAEASAQSAGQSAGLAATFEPANFDLKSDPINANRIVGTISVANLPVMPGPAHFASTGGFADLTASQQSAIKSGDFVTITDGRRWVYKGSGSKTAEASYIKIADDTPSWDMIDGRPTTFLPTAHSHNHTDINGFTWANLGSKPLTFAPSAHGHDWSEITGRPTTFAPTAHTHVIADVTGLQSALDGKASNTSPTLFGHTRIEGPAGSDRIITMATGSKSRWSMMAQAGPENGSNSGSDYWLTNYNDDGSYKGSALEIRRSDNRALFLGGIQAATLTLNTGLIYPNGNDTVLRTGAAGGERYYAFGGDGVFRSLNGGMAASGLVHSNGFVSHSTPTGVYQRFKDNGTATGKALLQYKDTENFYMMTTNQGDADGGFNGLRPFVLNLTSGNISMNHGLTVSGDTINVNGGNNANSTLIRRGSLEIRDDNYGPYVDFSTDGTTDFHARVSVPKSDGRLWLSHGAGGSVIVGPTIEANSNNGSQAGSVITHAGSEQIMAKQLTFPSIQNPQDSGANALLEVRGAGGGYGAWMKFHRPGAYGTYFGMFEDGEFGYGGWSAGGTIRKFWTEKNFDPLSRMERYCDGWVSTRDGNERFYFATNGRTYMRSRNGFEWRDNGDVWQAILTNDGVFETKNTISTLGNNIKIRGGSPTIYFKDTDNRSAMIHVNANKFYVLRGAGNDSETWTSTGSGWPLEIDLENNNASFGANIYTGTDHWFRVRGTSGIYWENWGGGWFMNDSSWLRAYNDKNIVTGGQVQMGSFTVTSDRRLKTDITPIPLDEASRIIDETNVYEFTKGGRRMFGMIAQEAQEVAPILVSEGADLHEDGDAILSLDQTGYIPLLLAEVRSLRQRVAELEAKIK